MPQKILIVDDDIDSLKLIGLMLQRQGYIVIAANTGNQAISRAAAEIPDLIILDVMMPDMNGYDVCRHLRDNPKTQGIPIIMFTAKTLIDDKVAGFEAGADDYLTKPTHPAELTSRVKAMLQRTPTPTVKETRRGNAIGVVGVKGGVGTTTLALNLAAALKQSGQTPLLADFRLGAGTLAHYMGVGKHNGMATVLSQPANKINQALVEQEIIIDENGLRGLLASTDPEEAMLQPAIENYVTLIDVLRNIGKPAIIDLGAGYTPMLRAVQREVDKIVILVEPIRSTMAIAQDMLRELEKAVGKPHLKVVAFSRAQVPMQLSWADVEKMLQTEIQGIISAAPEPALQAVDAGMPMVLHQPNTIPAGQLVKLAERLKSTLEAL